VGVQRGRVAWLNEVEPWGRQQRVPHSCDGLGSDVNRMCVPWSLQRLRLHLPPLLRGYSVPKPCSVWSYLPPMLKGGLRGVDRSKSNCSAVPCGRRN